MAGLPGLFSAGSMRFRDVAPGRETPLGIALIELSSFAGESASLIMVDSETLWSPGSRSHE